jgi:hypothetical protein
MAGGVPWHAHVLVMMTVFICSGGAATRPRQGGHHRREAPPLFAPAMSPLSRSVSSRVSRRRETCGCVLARSRSTAHAAHVLFAVACDSSADEGRRKRGGGGGGDGAYYSEATSEGLDWPVLWSRLVSLTKTEAGRARMCDPRSQVCQNVADVMFAHDCIGELRSLRASRLALGVGAAWGDVSGAGLMPLEGILDVSEVAARTAKGGVLEVSDVQRLLQTLPVMLLLADFLSHPTACNTCPTIHRLVEILKRQLPIARSTIVMTFENFWQWKSNGGGLLSSAVTTPLKNALDRQGQLRCDFDYSYFRDFLQFSPILRQFGAGRNSFWPPSPP